MKKNIFILSVLVFFVLTSCSNMYNDLDTVIISYETKYSTAPKAIKVNTSSCVTKDALPILDDDNYSFIGWFVDDIMVTSSYKVSNDVTFTAKWFYKTSPKDIKTETRDKEVLISWNNITREDYSTMEISYGNNHTEYVPKGTNEVIIKGLENGKKHSFTLRTIDINGNKSDSTTVYCYSMNGLTEKPTVLLDKEIENNGRKFQVIQFGDYPQSLKPLHVTLSDETIKIGNWNCYYGSDGYYYIKDTSSNYSIQNGYYYFKAVYTPVVPNKDYYFRLEPINWRVLGTNANGQKILLAEKALFSCYYLFYNAVHNAPRVINGKEIQHNDYEYSEFRAYLLGLEYQNIENKTVNTYKDKGFLQMAFTTNAQKLLLENNMDKVSILKQSDLIEEYGLEDRSSLRIKYPSDYAISHYLEKEASYFSCNWVINDGEKDGASVTTVRYNGLLETESTSRRFLSVVPTILIK